MPEITDLKFFADAAALRAWFAKNHARATEVWFGFHRKDSGRGGVTYAEALDEALCFGWIDGIRKKVDDTSYANRFTPRKPTSIWSQVNLGHVARLERLGRMTDAGRAALARRTAARTGTYSFEQPKEIRFDGASAKVFRAAKSAWKFFAAQPPGYRRRVTWWVISAKQPETRAARLEKLVAASVAGNRLE